MTSRIPSRDLRERLDDLRLPFDPSREPDYNERPISLLLATNMISVGLDVPRLGLMVVVGQPKSTSEYIQATSRVGRSAAGPGLVATILNWTRPRDLSHYERFEHFHATYYRQVEPLSVTPFAERALDRGLTGILFGLLRGLREDWSPGHGASVIDRHDPLLAEIMDGLITRAADVSGKSAVGTELRKEVDRRLDALADRQRRSGAMLDYARSGKNAVALLRKPEAGPWDVWTCPQSLRTTEPTVNLLIDDVDPTFGSGGAFHLPTEPRPALTETAGLVAAADDELDSDGDEDVEMLP